MLAKIQKWGNSQGLRLNKNILQDVQLSIGDEVDVRVQNGVMVITPMIKNRGKHRLEDLVADMPVENQPAEIDWGNAVGKEAW